MYKTRLRKRFDPLYINVVIGTCRFTIDQLEKLWAQERLLDCVDLLIIQQVSFGYVLLKLLKFL